MSLRLCFCLRGQWRRLDILLLWAGQTVSQVGLLVTGFALSLTTIVLLHASTAQVALLSVTGTPHGLVLAGG